LTRELMAAFDRSGRPGPFGPGSAGFLESGNADHVGPGEPHVAAALTPATSRLTLVHSLLAARTPGDAEGERASRALDVTGGRDITSAFGYRRDPFTGATRFHRGVDLRAAYGQDVATSAGGTVAFSGTQGDYGTTVVVEHANGTRTRFAHLSVALVTAGDTVEPGQVVGRAGSSGRATGAHLHLEVTDRAGRPLDPLIHPDSHR
jgi:murein DD-endopeptidase MepM/ murein hydrolase activator NlpD